MKSFIYFSTIMILLSACSQKCDTPHIKPSQELNKTVCETKPEIEAKILFESLPKTHLLESDFSKLPNWNAENYESALSSFVESCRTPRTQAMYKELCAKAKHTKDPKKFLETEFSPYAINTDEGNDEGLLTGYYEPHLHGSLVRTSRYKYPIYKTPLDLIVVDLSEIYPDLKNYRLRGRLEGNKLVPYYTRKQSKSKHLRAQVLCYVDSKIDRFFLEIQGSGRVTLRDGKTMYLGYDNQNGHRYRAIGRYLVSIGALKLQEVSLQSIRRWLHDNPKRVDEVLNYNKSLVFFKEKQQPATGSLGVVLTPKRSVAVDRRYIPLGSMLYVDADMREKRFCSLVLAQDTGGAIKGAVRADLFLGYGKDAMKIAGELKAPLKLWILLPKQNYKKESS